MPRERGTRLPNLAQETKSPDSYLRGEGQTTIYLGSIILFWVGDIHARRASPASFVLVWQS